MKNPNGIPTKISHEPGNRFLDVPESLSGPINYQSTAEALRLVCVKKVDLPKQASSYFVRNRKIAFVDGTKMEGQGKQPW